MPPADVRGAITQNDSTITAATVDSVESDTTKTVFTYGDTIVVKVVGPSPKAANALSVEQKTIALLYGEAVLDTETVSEYGGTYYLTYETAGQKIPTGNSIQLQVVYGGNGNLKESTANVSVTLNPKPVTAVVENEITKFYDGEKNAAVTLAFGEGAILTGDEVNVSAPNAAYTTAEAGTGIAINFGSLTVTGKDAG